MRRILLLFFLLAVGVLYAQMPAGYYSAADNKAGNALRVSLYGIIKTHTSLSYGALWDAFYTTDVRPDNNMVWDIYSDNPDGVTAYYFSFGTDQCGNYSGEGDCYNREHSVPKSWFNDATPMYTDLFHLYPTDGWVNNKRGNLPLGEVGSPTWTSTNGSKLGSCITSGYNGTVFEPIDAYKGDLARTYLYMTVCYMDKNLGYEQSMFTGGSLKPWALDMLMRWHQQDPVSQKEIDRNNAVFVLQGNRNPFIDFPELVGKIYGADSTNPFHPDGIEVWENPVHWSLYPVPAVTDVTIVPPVPLEEEILLQVLDIAGQVVRQERPVPAERYTVSVSDLPAGMYVLRIQGSNFCIARKMVVGR
ncbi:MAG: endonuclease [Bacteroidales bacterium]|nr:endonuclease [Bacteroidales bacterium]